MPEDTASADLLGDLINLHLFSLTSKANQKRERKRKKPQITWLNILPLPLVKARAPKRLCYSLGSNKIAMSELHQRMSF